MVLMILSNRLVRSAWKAFHCRQHRKMTIAASGRPLWKPTSPVRESETYVKFTVAIDHAYHL